MTTGTGKAYVIAFIDIGTNSVRLLVVRINRNGSYNVLSQEKEMVRLGEAEFKENLLIEPAIERAVTVCQKFAQLSRHYGSMEIVAVATSATREAQNQRVLLDRIRSRAHLDVHVISGKEEARLIYLGVSSGVNIGDRKALFIDIGGGSCEIMIGDQHHYTYLDSLNLGAIRMTTMFLPEGHRGPVPNRTYSQMCKSVRSAIIRTKKQVEEERPDLAIASSGTAVNLAQIAARMFDLPGDQPLMLKRSHLRKVAAHLRSLNLERRREVPGINPERADIIVGGAATLETLMEELDLQEVLISERGLRDGLLMEHLAQNGFLPDSREVNVRWRSVMQLGRSYDLDEEHAGRVRELALQLFDSAKARRLHDLGDVDRELFSYAAFMHDIGDFISFNNHHLHSHYIISNAELLGFDQRDIGVMANVAKYHRKRVPRKKDPELEGIDARSQETIIKLSSLLRLAEGLDRSHAGLVQGVSFGPKGKGRITLDIRSREECQLECWGVMADKKAFERAFGLELEVKTTEIEPDSPV